MSGLPPIGLSGFAGSGKTEAARHIGLRFGYERQHIADPLRAMLAVLFDEYGYDRDAAERFLTGDRKEHVVPELGVTSRHLQITLGTEWGRRCVGANIWTNLWGFKASRAATARLNDSVRFPNEEQVIRDMGGIVILIERPGVGPAAFKWKRLGPALYRMFGCMWGVHDSERVDRLKPDYVVRNDGSIDDLQQQIAAIVENLNGKARK